MKYQQLFDLLPTPRKETIPLFAFFRAIQNIFMQLVLQCTYTTVTCFCKFLVLNIGYEYIVGMKTLNDIGESKWEQQSFFCKLASIAMINPLSRYMRTYPTTPTSLDRQIPMICYVRKCFQFLDTSSRVGALIVF